MNPPQESKEEWKEEWKEETKEEWKEGIKEEWKEQGTDLSCANETKEEKEERFPKKRMEVEPIKARSKTRAKVNEDIDVS